MPYLYLVRHAQPDFAGNYDSITALGAQQSTWLGEHFAAQGLRFARVVSGTMVRQIATRDLIATALGRAREDLQDAGFNEYDHASLLETFERDRLQAIRASGDRRLYFTAIRSAMEQWSRREEALAGGETWAQFGARIHDGVERACADLQREDNVLIVTSGGVIGRYTADLLGADADTAIQLNLQVRNTSVSEVIRPAGKPARLVSFNAIAHLERAGRSHAITHS